MTSPPHPHAMFFRHTVVPIMVSVVMTIIFLIDATDVVILSAKWTDAVVVPAAHRQASRLPSLRSQFSQFTGNGVGKRELFDTVIMRL